MEEYDIMELDYTQLSLFTFCPRKYKYIYRDCLEHHVGNAAHFSSLLVHQGIAAWYKNEKPDWAGWYDLYLAVVPKPDDELYTLPRAQKVVELYSEQFASDREEYELVGAEVAGSFEISNNDRFISKPDLILSEKTTGNRGVIDIKTSKWAINAELITFDRQFLGQARLVGAQWMMKSHVQLLKKDTRLTRSYRLVTPDLLDEWQREIETVYAFIAICEKTGVWPKQAPGSCTSYNSLCEFVELCGMGKLREQIVTNWKKVDPFAYLTK